MRDEKVLPNNDKTFEIMEKEKSSLILCGHTHIQFRVEHNGKNIIIQDLLVFLYIAMENHSF